MENKKIISVLGATGAQGGSLIKAMLDDPDNEFSPRALTRNPNSDKAKELTELGVEVVFADVDDEGSLKNAFDGAYGAYCVTFFWEHFSPEKEAQQIASFAKVSSEKNLKHVIWSTLEDTRKWVPLSDDRMPTLMDKYKVPHFDAKGESDKYFEEAGVPTTYLLTSFYWDNFIHFGMGPKRGEDGKLNLVLPMNDKKLPGIAAEDIGKCALGILKEGEKFIGQRVAIAGEKLTGRQMADILSKHLGEEVNYSSVPFEVYRGFGFPGSDDLGNMFQFKHDFEDYFCGIRDIDLSKQLNPTLQSFEDWVQRNIDKIPKD
jgi:uncharacterized protein YbjT (DUF2867 family)